MLNSKSPQDKKDEEYNTTLLELSADAVISYEKYLLDQMNHKDLAKVMKTLRAHIEKKSSNRNIFS
jgi:hypothetical protein